MKISSSTFPSSSPDGSDCDMEFAVVMLNCWSRRQRSLYSRNSLGYSPSKACFRCMEAIHNNKKRTEKSISTSHNLKVYSTVYLYQSHEKKINFLISWSTSRVLWSLVHVHVLILNYNICHVRPLSSISESISVNNNVHYFTSQKMLWI